jgi:methylglutaconyl-CoA hydratase
VGSTTGRKAVESSGDMGNRRAGGRRRFESGDAENTNMMNSFEMIDVAVDARGVATLTLNRPEAKNAMSQPLMRELGAATKQLAADPQVRLIVLTGAGEVFSAGGDLKGMSQQAKNTREGRIGDAHEFALTLAELDRLPKPLIGRINGSAFGGGVGLISICDIAIGLTSSTFRLTEVTLGLIPATISPYVVAKIGTSHARRIMLNASKLDGTSAVRWGLLDEAVATVEELDAAVEREVIATLQCAPNAVAQCKELIRRVSAQGPEENLAYTVQALADAWETAEIREGIDAFFNKRKPNWQT